MFVGAAEGFHFDFARVFFKTKGQSDDAYQTNGVDDGDEDTSESYLECQRKARGERGKGTRRGGGRTSSKEVSTAKGIYLTIKGHH